MTSLLKKISPSFGMVAFIALISAASSFASETIELTRGDHQAQSDVVEIIRTSRTPKKVDVELTVPIGVSRCAEMGTRIVFGPHPSCGNETVLIRECHNQCIKLGNCQFLPNGERKCQCLETGNVCQNVPRTAVRQCSHPEAACVRTEVVSHAETRQVTVNFRDSLKLGPNENEIFELSAVQTRIDGSNVDFRLRQIKASVNYEIKSQDLLIKKRILVNKP